MTPLFPAGHRPTILITGSSGFLGNALILELLSTDCPVNPSLLRLFDINDGPGTGDDRVQVIKGSICNYDDVLDACNGIEMVIHAAAIVDWGTRPEETVYAVNVTGTENIIRACRESGVRALVFTSSLDAVYSGKPLVNIDETYPWPARHPNMYCRSKFLSEKMVLEANNYSLKTAILRPSDIYGEGDPYHIGSLVDMARGGFYVRLGNGKTKCQHVYVRNMAYAHALVLKEMMNGNDRVPGSVYFITDGPGSNFFRFYERIVAGAGYRVWPKNLWLPRYLSYSIGWINEAVAWLVRPFYKYTPKFSRFAVLYTCSDFTFSSEKAGRELGYVPKYSEEEAVKRTIEYYRKERETGKG